MLLAGQKVKTSPAGKPASKFRPFFPWYYANSGLISLNISLSALILSSFPTTHTAPVSRIAFVIGARARMSSTVAFKIYSRSFFSISSVTPEYHAESPRLPCKDGVSGVSISLMVPMTYFVMVRSSASKFSR